MNKSAFILFAVQVQMAAVGVVPAVLDSVTDEVARTELLPRARTIYGVNRRFSVKFMFKMYLSRQTGRT